MRTILMTGATSGIGKIAARRMAGVPDVQLVFGARRPPSSQRRTLPLDLARLDSVRTFAATVNSRLGPNAIDALVLNAGTSLPTDEERTEDGIETTFAVNHLGHYVLLRLLLHRLAHGASVVITTSSTHDPAESTVVAPPRHADANLLAHPEQDPHRDQQPRTAGGRAYSSSKLCNILTARALASQTGTQRRHFCVVAYNPGPTPGTGLMRHAPLAMRAAWRALVPARPLIPRFNSRAAAGNTLADLALGNIRPSPGHIYAALRRGNLTWPDPSQLARRDDLRDALWRDSAALAGLPDHAPSSRGHACADRETADSWFREIPDTPSSVNQGVGAVPRL
jgi:NAD(P)-dependent dehydrogenase (short-subunit alcohol dehydrogenase family)